VKIIGRLIKKTTEIGYRRVNRKLIGHQHQTLVLKELLNKAKDTDFGKQYSFGKWWLKKDIVVFFKSKSQFKTTRLFTTIGYNLPSKAETIAHGLERLNILRSLQGPQEVRVSAFQLV